MGDRGIFSLPGWMPFCFAKRHSRVRIRKRTFWYTPLSVEGPFWSHFRCEGNGTDVTRAQQPYSSNRSLIPKVRFKRLGLRFLEIKGRSVYLLKGDPEFPGISGQVL
eukprot:sb/3477699/